MNRIVMGCLTLSILLGLTSCGKDEVEPLKEKVSQYEQEIQSLKKAQEELEQESQAERERIEKGTQSQKEQMSNLALELTRLESGWVKICEVATESVVVLSANRLRGTGFVITESGYVLSNGHLSGSTQPYQVTFIDGQSYPCQVIAATRKTDLALFKIEAERTFKPVKLGNSAELIIGEAIVALGNGKGLGVTATSGIVSGLDRTITTDYGVLKNLIQVDASITDGFSGGPVFNRRGEVVGMIACTIGTHTNFAIPIDQIQDLFPEMLKIKSRYGFVLGMKVATHGPANVTEVTAGLPAEVSGVKVGDLVTNLNGIDIKRGLDFYLALIDQETSMTLSLKLQRNGTTIDTIVTLGKQEPRPSEPVERVVNGLKLDYYEGKWEELPDFAQLEPAQSGTADTFVLGEYKNKDHFGLRFTGYIKVIEEGVYVFYTNSDDGSHLYIGDQLVVDNDGLHSPSEERGFISLEAGFHPITVTVFEYEGGEHLGVYYKGPGIKKRVIPKALLYHKE